MLLSVEKRPLERKIKGKEQISNVSKPTRLIGFNR
jgi:hypothetical protein